MGANPVDRGKPGSKFHLITDADGLPLAVAVTAANVNDVTMFEGLLDDLPAVRTLRVGGAADPARSMPTKRMTPGMLADTCAGVGSLPASPVAGWSPRSGWAASVGGSSGRCRAELLPAGAVRWDRASERWFAFVLLACALVCWHRLRGARS